LNGTGTYYENAYFLKLDAAGNFIWALQINGPLVFPPEITTGGNGTAYLTGQFSGTVDFDPGVGVSNSSALSTDIFVLKLDASGNFIWVKTMGGAGSGSGQHIKVTSTGSIYSTGTFIGTIDFDPGAPVFNLSSTGNSDLYVHKMSQCINNTFSTLTVTDCKNYTLNGQTYTTSGVYIQTLVNAAGCDSIITLNLTINSISTQFNVATCYDYVWNGQTYTNSGTYRDTLMTANGCDSIVTLNLVINSRSLSVVNAAICQGQYYEGYSTTGTYIDTLVAANSCDSIRTLNLTVSAGTFSTIDTTICSGRNYAGYTRTGIYIDTLVAANGCDSVRTIDLTVKNNCGIYIPNAFTPNNNSLNDLFMPIINLPFQQYSFVIFNRYGQKVFETREYGKGWDGRFKGKEQSSGAYVYRITFTNISGWTTVENGSVLLIR
jgi:gliding motility-associated-like protein